MMMSKLCSAMAGSALRDAGGDARNARGPGDERRGPAIQANSRALRKARSPRPGQRGSDVAARAQILVEQLVVAVDVGLVRGGELLALARRLDLALRAPRRAGRAPAGSCRRSVPAASGVAPGSPPQPSPSAQPASAAASATAASSSQRFDIVRATNASFSLHPPPCRSTKHNAAMISTAGGTVTTLQQRKLSAENCGRSRRIAVAACKCGRSAHDARPARYEQPATHTSA